MNFIHFHEMFLQQVFFHCNRPIGHKYAHNEKTRRTEVSWRNNVYNAKYNVKTRLEHCFAIEYTYCQ